MSVFTVLMIFLAGGCIGYTLHHLISVRRHMAARKLFIGASRLSTEGPTETSGRSRSYGDHPAKMRIPLRAIAWPPGVVLAS